MALKDTDISVEKFEILNLIKNLILILVKLISFKLIKELS